MTRSALLLGLSLGLCVAPTSAAPAAGADNSQGNSQKRRVRIKPAPQHDNGESAADRDRRLRRECRGLPNAGACSGYGYGS
jgi:hypothetical protein